MRKDFIVDDYQLYESKLIGADAVLLICALLDRDTIHRYLQICDTLWACLCSSRRMMKQRSETMPLRPGRGSSASTTGTLKTFEVDLNNCVRLRPLVPENTLFVAESGIKTTTDIKTLKTAGVNAVLIGETLMRNPDKKAALDTFRGAASMKIKICGLTRDGRYRRRQRVRCRIISALCLPKAAGRSDWRTRPR